MISIHNSYGGHGMFTERPNPLHQIGMCLLVPTAWDDPTIRFFFKKNVYEIDVICAKLQVIFYRWMKPNYLTLLASVVNNIQPECPTFTFFRPGIGSLDDMRPRFLH